MAELEIRPVGVEQLPAMRQLFSRSRATRHCWCMAFCSTSWQFATGWYGGGNQRRFEAMTATDDEPMGVMASSGGEPVGWTACGPRARYTAAIAGRSELLRDRDRAEDHHVWLIACLYVVPGHHPGALTVMLRSAVELARDRGAAAIEAWPPAGGRHRPAEAHLGSEALFARAGFSRSGAPTAQRVIMRRRLAGALPEEDGRG